MTLNDIKFNSKDIVNIDLTTEVMPEVDSGEQLYLEELVYQPNTTLFDVTLGRKRSDLCRLFRSIIWC